MKQIDRNHHLISENTDLEKSRKNDHVDLAYQSQINQNQKLNHFNYEPLFTSHRSALNNTDKLERQFLGKQLRAPLWISSMTGGGSRSKKLNHMFAEVAAEFGLGMGLGSCRPLLTKSDSFEDFNVRKIIGKALPLVANIGQGQIEELIRDNEMNRLNDLISSLDADGLIFHINPMQEWFQPEGDRFEKTPLEIIQLLLEELNCPLIVKEVGQGFGPKSMLALCKLPLAGIEFGAFGGTNFSYLETLRTQNNEQENDPLCYVGHTAEEMVNMVNHYIESSELSSKELPMMIISGGIRNYLHAHQLMKMSKFNTMYAQAGKLLFAAEKSKIDLQKYISAQIDGLKMAQNYLTLEGE